MGSSSSSSGTVVVVVAETVVTFPVQRCLPIHKVQGQTGITKATDCDKAGPIISLGEA